MLILLSTPDQAQTTRLTGELSAAGHEVRHYEAGTEVDAAAGLLIIDGLEDVVVAHDAPVHILALVGSEELTLFPECPRQVSDFILKPLREGELMARVQLIEASASWREQTLHRLLAHAVDATSDIIQVATPDAVLEYVNPAYERCLGIPRDEVVGKTVASLERSGQHPREFVDAVEQALDRGESWSGTMISKGRDGRLIHFDTTISPISDSKGSITHHMAVKRDITERLARREALMQANRALSQARDAAVAASRTKSEFLANMSHELRTPLNAIIGYSEMLMEDAESADEQTRSDLDRIRAAGTHLLALINDVLDISKIEADRIELSPERFAMSEMLEAVSELVRPMAKKNGNRFTIEAADDLGSIIADRMRLRQVLVNLLSNACKFTKDGEVGLSATRCVVDGSPHVALRVRDSGIGISEEQRTRLFQPFMQADSSTTREYGGTGLGLVICKRLTELMGGEIELESELGKGSTFTVRLPIDRAGSISIRPGAPEPSVLLIDDDPAVRDLFVRVLGRRGFQVQVAASGPTGLEYAMQLEPDVIVLDVKMPGMSGWEVLSTLKLNEKTAHIPVIMLTVMQQEEVGQALGAVDYVIKPIDPDALGRTLRRHLSEAKAGSEVLVVEDDEPTRELIRRTLERAGLTVSEAENGQVALDHLEHNTPDIVVLDLMMPVMDGFTFLQRLRADATHRNIPVIVATARQLSDAERRELAATAQRVIEKTAHSRQELLEMIGTQIEDLVLRPLEG